MTKMNIISAAMVVASFAGVAMAGTKTVTEYRPAPKPYEKRFFGALSAGYSTNYDYRGLIPETSSGTNYTPVSLDMKYKLSDYWELYTNIDYKAIWDKDIDVNNNEFAVEFGGKTKRWIKGLTIAPNYKLNHGGWMGDVVKYGRNKSHSIFQSFGVGLLYDLGAVGADGFFIAGSADYVFDNAPGWWFQGKLGYEARFNERVSAIVTLEYNATASFYGAWAGPMSDGDMSYGVKLDIPVKLCKNVIFTPFIGTWWLGSSGNNANVKGARENTLRNFTLVAGANLTYMF